MYTFTYHQYFYDTFAVITHHVFSQCVVQVVNWFCILQSGYFSAEITLPLYYSFKSLFIKIAFLNLFDEVSEICYFLGSRTKVENFTSFFGFFNPSLGWSFVFFFLIGKPKKKSRCRVRKPATLTILLRERT